MVGAAFDVNVPVDVNVDDCGRFRSHLFRDKCGLSISIIMEG